MIMKLVRAKNDSCARFFAPNGKPNYMKIYENFHVYSYKTPVKKAQPNFLQTTRKPGRILIIFVIFFAFIQAQRVSNFTSKQLTLDKMILLSVKLSRIDFSSTQLKRGFNFPFKFIYGQSVTRSRS